MNVIFLTIGDFKNVNEHGIYLDLLRYFSDNGHDVTVVCAFEKRYGKKTVLEKQQNIKILRIKTGNITKVNLIEKGISTLRIAGQYEKAIKKFLPNIKADLILYSTPPITLYRVVNIIKKRTGAHTYLMLKDIFPIGALDLGMLSKKGLKGLVYQYFRQIEKKLYKISDAIGCMSDANVEYVIKNNPYIPPDKVEVCPNAADIYSCDDVIKEDILTKYKIPNNKLILIYGGNFGRPQNVDYIVSVMKAAGKLSEIHFVMCGSGTHFDKIKGYEAQGYDNITIVDSLPNKEYRRLLMACDIGLIFLDYRFTFPNFPSRLLDYMNCELPVFAATDTVSDIGTVIKDGGFGWWCESKSVENYINKLKEIVSDVYNNAENLKIMGNRAKMYLKNNYRTGIAYDTIVHSVQERGKVKL